MANENGEINEQNELLRKINSKLGWGIFLLIVLIIIAVIIYMEQNSIFSGINEIFMRIGEMRIY